jgi:glycosyltransferase involved in cell wall biosynthesis
MLRSPARTSRTNGLSAFIRCKNEEEYILASILSIYRIFDEIVVVLNNSTDGTRRLIEDLLPDHPKIRLLDYPTECIKVGPGYYERVVANPLGSLARYYNWCLEQTRYSHVCKWDGDMIATPPLEQVRALIPVSEIIQFDGYDVLGEPTTDYEPRIFKFDPLKARYVDWDLYEILQHEYSKISRVPDKCYLHMKLLKKEWIHQKWVNPNLSAVRSVPETGADAIKRTLRSGSLIRRISHSLWSRTFGRLRTTLWSKQ